MESDGKKPPGEGDRQAAMMKLWLYLAAGAVVLLFLWSLTVHL
jgi:hypothetical protein